MMRSDSATSLRSIRPPMIAAGAQGMIFRNHALAFWWWLAPARRDCSANFTNSADALHQ